MSLGSIVAVLTLALAPVRAPAPAFSMALAEPGSTPAAAAPPPSDSARPERSGTGLLTVGALLGVAGLGVNIARISLARELCTGVAFDPASLGLVGTESCIAESKSLLLLSPTALGLNLAGFGLITGGSALRGRGAAHDQVFLGGRQRRGDAQIRLGAALLAASLAGYVLLRVSSYQDGFGLDTCVAHHPVEATRLEGSIHDLAGCARARYSGYLSGFTVMQSTALVGVGLLAHGAGYRHYLKKYRVLARHEVRLQPSFSPRWAGIAVSGRF